MVRVEDGRRRAVVSKASRSLSKTKGKFLFEVFIIVYFLVTRHWKNRKRRKRTRRKLMKRRTIKMIRSKKILLKLNQRIPSRSDLAY